MNIAPANNFARWDGPHGLPRFSELSDDGFAGAFEAAMARHDAEIAAIARQSEPATFANVIGALERAGRELTRVSAIFWLRAGAHTNDAIQTLERDIAPKLARHFSKIAQNPALFARVDALWTGRDKLGLTREEFRVLERHWKAMVRAGAALEEAGKVELAAINERLAALGAQFGQNVLTDEAEWDLHLTAEQDLAGLPGFLRSAMAQAAREHGHDNGWSVTLSRSIIEPFLTFSERRDLREAAWRAWTARGEGRNDNRPIVAETLQLRARKAELLGYPNYAAYKLDDTMAKTPEAVDELLLPVWQKARERAERDRQALEVIAAEGGANEAIAPWDWRFFAEKRRQREFDFSEEELKSYLPLENIIAACFEVAGKLFGLSFRRFDAALWHADVRAFEVLDATGNRVGVFLADYFARPSKRSGAWMSDLQEQHKLDGGQIPVIYNIMNFAKPPAGEPALLSLDDARTLFHEFGHALHGLLSDVTWPTVSGTSVARDFVELPSQLYEHWLTVPDILARHARHHATGKPMPKELMDKVLKAKNANSGFQTVEFTASALVDMAFHTGYRPQAEGADPMAFEAEKLGAIGMPAEIAMRHRTPHFAHVFSGDGYSAGYYSYMWSEVLDADAFAAFEETGDAFDAATAARLREHIYAAGGSVDPAETYLAFRGKMPSPEAMMKGRGLI
jgi:peptidyl-dipeptidase Dcp